MSGRASVNSDRVLHQTRATRPQDGPAATVSHRIVWLVDIFLFLHFILRLDLKKEESLSVNPGVKNAIYIVYTENSFWQSKD